MLAEMSNNFIHPDAPGKKEIVRIGSRKSEVRSWRKT
jgi:hypothetical protein